ncbi:Uma2 family endonuclease [Streptomyces chrestomyceticus]|uniref:Uma2 family endonuclease n=1 Tax=Streptomyces chrestomyceticus TaxID=68185 RepID=UPI0036AFFA59
MALTVPEPEPWAAGERAPASAEEAFEALSAAAPKGWRVELIEGEIHVVPPPAGRHEEIVSELSGQVRDHRKDLGRYTNLGLSVPGSTSTGKVIPDLAVAPKGSFDDDIGFHDPSPVMLVVEVLSSSTAGNDRIKKLRGYARAGIPCYLLIDRAADLATLCAEPSGDQYLKVCEINLAEKVISLPDPLNFDLDTTQF